MRRTTSIRLERPALTAMMVSDCTRIVSISVCSTLFGNRQADSIFYSEIAHRLLHQAHAVVTLLLCVR